MVRLRQAWLIIAMMGMIVICICDGIVINAMNDFTSGNVAAFIHSKNVENALSTSIICGIIMGVALVLAAAFLFIDGKAKQKIIGFGWIFFSFIYVIFTSSCKYADYADNDFDDEKGLLITGLIFTVFLFILGVVGLVSAEKEQKQQAGFMGASQQNSSQDSVHNPNDNIHQ